MKPRMFVRIAGWLPLALVFGASVAHAQLGGGAFTSPSSASDSLAFSRPNARDVAPIGDVLPGPVDPARYRLGPGDGLVLEFSGRVNRLVPIPVDAEGRASFPDLGVRSVGGRTLGEVRGEVLAKLRPIYSGARVDLRLVTLRQFKVYLAGAVARPGVTLATGATRASELFEGAQGLPETSSRRNLELRHRDGRTERVDLDAFARRGLETANPFLEDGDVVFVPMLKERIAAFGAFGRPGEYELAPGDRVSDLVGLAGGTLPGTDAASGVLVRFAGATRLDSMLVSLEASNASEDVLLQDRDRLYARETPEFKRPRNVTLSGEFQRPGVYSIFEGEDRLSSAVARAGGLTDAAAASRLQIFRPPMGVGQRDIEFERLARLSRSEMTDAEYQTFKSKLASQQSAFVVSMDQLHSNSGDYNVLLRDGDVIVADREMLAVRVAGEVLRPSLIEYVPNRSGRDYIRLAGGYTSRAEGGKSRLTRAGSNQTIFLSEAPVIQPGDFIWVPEKKEFSFWATFKDVILVAGSVATVIILLRDQ